MSSPQVLQRQRLATSDFVHAGPDSPPDGICEHSGSLFSIRLIFCRAAPYRFAS